MVRYLIPMMLLAGCTATPAQVARDDARQDRDRAKLEKRLAGFEPGEPVDCIRQFNSNVAIYGDQLLYQEGAGRLYRTQTSGGCFGLKRDDIIVTKSFNGQLCRGDIIRTVDRTAGFQSGACTIGTFTPYRRPPRG